MSMSKFEQLPDEIILEICIYLRSFEIIDAFGKLNYRLDRTITEYCAISDTHHLTLIQYKHWFKHTLPYISESVSKLILSNWNSPGQIFQFNQSTKTYRHLYELFPNLEQVRLIDFSNEDIDILPKLDRIDRILIDIDALKPLVYATKILLDRYLFCSTFPFKEIRLWIGEGGIRLQHRANSNVNPNLEKVTIVVARIDDLMVLFQRAPNLIKLYVEISQSTVGDSKQYLTNEFMPKNLTDFHIQTNDQQAVAFDDIFEIIIYTPTIRLLSIDVETNDRDYADGLCWQFLISRLPNLQHLFIKTRIWLRTETNSFNLDYYLKSFEQTNLPIICYGDKRVLHIDTIPYDMHTFDTNMAVTTSPFARYAKISDVESYKKPARRVQLLFLCGRHEPTSVQDWIFILNRFPCIRALDLTAVNIIDEITTNKNDLYLPHLVALRYVRSTRCEINISFFLLLTMNNQITPRLRALTVMYGDLIYLCKRLPDYSFDRLKELLVCSSDTDGRIVLTDIDCLLKAFRNLQTFTFLIQSSRAINRHIQQIIELILCSLPNLISFRLLCRKGSFSLPKLADIDKQKIWLKSIFNITCDEDIHLQITKREISIWK